MAKLNTGTRIYGTANVDTQINIGANVVANTIAFAIGTAFIANTTQVTLSGIPLSANASVGTQGQALLSNGATGSPYWGTSAVGASYVQNTDSRTLSGNLVISGTYFNPSANTVLLGNTLQRWVVSANTIDASGLITGGAGATITGQINASTGFGSGTINATSNGLFANSTTISVGNSSVNVSITPSTIDLGTQFDANSTGLYHTGTINAASHTSGTINATSNGLISNSTTITVGNTSVNVTITTAGITSAGGTGVNPSSNTVGTALGTSTQRWVLNANTGSFAGAVSGITTLAAGNTTVTGFVNATSTIQGGSSLTIAGALSGVTTAAMGNTTITGFANVTTSIQGGSSLTIAGAASGITTLAAGNTTITGFANASVSVNSALLTVGTSFIANTTGAYHTGLVNAASISVGSGSFVANATAVVISDPLTANGTTGTAAQVLTSNGTVGAPYWSTVASGGTVTATDDTATNASRYILFADQTSGTVTAAYVSSTKLTYNPSTGTLTSTVVTASSDEKLKTNINTIVDPIDVINNLRGVSFDRIDTKKKDFGVIAQEIEKILPDVVHQDLDGYKSVSYNSIIGFLIEGMKIQQRKIEELEFKIDNHK